MKSPFTGKPMLLSREKRALAFRKEAFEVIFHSYKCKDSGESFTTTPLDEINIRQVHNQYRAKHKLPFPEDVRKIREKYGLPASKMSEILGLGVNTYRNYESGEIPSLSNARLIQLADDETEFIKLAKLCETINQQTLNKILSKAASLINKKSQQQDFSHFEKYLFGDQHPDSYTGYVKPDISKLTEMVLFFAQRLNPWKTKLNKLLFYADFLMFSLFVKSMSGLRYKAIDLGPVPENYNSLFEYLVNTRHLDVEFVSFADGNIGERFSPHTNQKFTQTYVSEEEMNILNKVADYFENTSTKEIIDLSHQEAAWLKNHPNREFIDYAYGFELSINPATI